MKNWNAFVLVTILSLGIIFGVTLLTRLLGFPTPNTSGSLRANIEPGSSSADGDWSPVESGSREWLLSIDMIDRDNGWAAGSNGAIFQLEGGVWQKIESPTGSELVALVMKDHNRGWAVGNNPPAFLSYTSAGWEMVDDPISGDDLYGIMSEAENPIRTGGLYDIELFGDDQAIAVGGRLGLNDWAALIRLNETGQWFSLIEHRQPFSLLGISLACDGSGWGVGDGVILPFAPDGSVEGEPQPIQIEATLTALDMVNSTEAWAVGKRGAMAHYRGGEWQLFETAWPDIDFFDIAMLNEDEGWAVGSHATIIHYDEGEWKLHSQQHPLVNLMRPVTLTAIDMVTEEEGWAVGTDGTILHYRS